VLNLLSVLSADEAGEGFWSEEVVEAFIPLFVLFAGCNFQHEKYLEDILGNVGEPAIAPLCAVVADVTKPCRGTAVGAVQVELVESSC
jgi:hypothetical protein